MLSPQALSKKKIRFGRDSNPCPQANALANWTAHYSRRVVNEYLWTVTGGLVLVAKISGCVSMVDPSYCISVFLRVKIKFLWVKIKCIKCMYVSSSLFAGVSGYVAGGNYVGQWHSCVHFTSLLISLQPSATRYITLYVFPWQFSTFILLFSLSLFP